MTRNQIIYDMAAAIVPQSCCDIARDGDGQPVILPSGDRLCCTRADGHYPRYPHADRDDSGQLVEWRSR